MSMWKKITALGFGSIVLAFVVASFTGDSSTVQIPSESNQGVETQSVSAEETLVQDSLVQTPESTTQAVSSTPAKTLYSVVSVVDGDTVKVNMNGTTETLRLIGINTPETVDPRKPVECFGKEASNKAKAVLTGKSVSIEKDVSQGERDKYARLLAYILLEDGTNFNKMMVSEGYAYEYTYNTPYKYQSEFKTAEANARNNKVGLWADGVCETVSQTTTVTPVQTTDTNGSYICSYNTYNCTDFKTHKEAQTAFDQCGGTSNDIHKLDQDKDGLACETLP